MLSMARLSLFLLAFTLVPSLTYASVHIVHIEVQLKQLSSMPESTKFSLKPFEVLPDHFQKTIKIPVAIELDDLWVNGGENSSCVAHTYYTRHQCILELSGNHFKIFFSPKHFQEIIQTSNKFFGYGDPFCKSWKELTQKSWPHAIGEVDVKDGKTKIQTPEEWLSGEGEGFEYVIRVVDPIEIPALKSYRSKL